MTAGYTEAELNTLQHAMLEYQPDDPSSGEIRAALPVIAAVTRARYNGLLLKILFQSKETLLLNLNCVVALELMVLINQAYSGWRADAPIQMLDAEIGIAAAEQPLDIISFAAGADTNGLPVNFTDGTQNFIVFLPSPVAIRILAAINSAGEVAGWWNKAFVFQPARMAEESEIQQEAAQLINRYREEAATESVRRSVSASEAGDKFNHELWERVTLAVREIELTAPADGNPLVNCILPRV